jgi:hypothetical protein
MSAEPRMDQPNQRGLRKKARNMVAPGADGGDSVEKAGCR